MNCNGRLRNWKNALQSCRKGWCIVTNAYTIGMTGTVTNCTCVRLAVGIAEAQKGRTMAEAEAWVMIPKSKNNGEEMVLDMKPLVLCKNCKYGDFYDGLYLCAKSIGWTEYKRPNWFCADGERKE